MVRRSNAGLASPYGLSGNSFSSLNISGRDTPSPPASAAIVVRVLSRLPFSIFVMLLSFILQRSASCRPVSPLAFLRSLTTFPKFIIRASFSSFVMLQMIFNIPDKVYGCSDGVAA
jgi:hypothetical protein